MSDVIPEAWRDELIRSGVDRSDEVRAVLQRREAKWLTTSHPHCEGSTPVQAIEAERVATARHLEEMRSRKPGPLA